MVACVTIATPQRISHGDNMTNKVKYLFFIALLIVGAATSSCIKAPTAEIEVDLTTSAYLSVFFNTPQPDQQLTVQISEVEVYAEPLWYPLTTYAVPSAPDLSAAGRTNQYLLASGSVTTANYTRIRFALQLSDSAGKLLRQEQTELSFESALECKAGNSTTLFITSQLSSNNLAALAQQFTVYPQQRPLADELLYILCPEIQTLYVARVNPCQIIAAYGIGSDIADMVIDNNGQQLYLLDRTNHLIQRFDTIAQTFTDRIPLPLADEPNNLSISADGTSLYVSDAYNRQLLKINTDNGTVNQQQNIGYQMGKPYPFSHQNQDYVALLSPREQQLTVLLAKSLSTIYTVNAGLQPYDLIYADQQLCVSDMFSRQILLIDPASGTITARIATTQMPSTLSVDSSNGNIIIGSNMDNTLAFLPFGQQLVARRTRVGGEVIDMAIASARRLLFAALKNKHQVSVVDLPSEKQISSICVAARPTVIVFQEP